MLNDINQGKLSLQSIQQNSNTDEKLVSRGHSSSFEEGNSSQEETENVIVVSQDQHGNLGIPGLGSTGEVKVEKTENSYVLHYFGELGNCEYLLQTIYPQDLYETLFDSYDWFNNYHSLGLFNRQHIDYIFLISLGDNLHKMSKPIFWRKYKKKYISNCCVLEFTPIILSVK